MCSSRLSRGISGEGGGSFEIKEVVAGIGRLFWSRIGLHRLLR